MLFFDPLYFLIAAPALFIMVYAQIKVRSIYGKYAKIRNMHGVDGLEVARTLMAAYGLTRVKVEQARGLLTDHYDPTKRTLRFSRDIYASPSVASLGIVAHEVGHALQHQQGYIPLRLRSALAPTANAGTWLGYLFFILGFLLGLANLVWLGVFLFSGAVLFSLITLPVEFDASRRARLMLRSTGLVSAEEYHAASAVLTAAAMTYVAALLQALSNLFYYIIVALGMSRRS